MPVSSIVVTPSPVPPALSPPPTAVDPAAIVPFQDELPIPPALRLDLVPGRAAECRIVLRNKLVRIHSALGRATPVWSYDLWDDAERGWLCDDQYLGPTLVVRRGQRVAVTYEDHLHGTLPFTPAVVDLGSDPQAAAHDPLVANAPGRAGVAPTSARALYGWAVAHLHGGRTAAMYDGWTENAMLPPRVEAAGPDLAGHPGQSQVSVYENQQPATMLWYHDHALGITRFMVYSGLAAAYLIRDPHQEHRLAARGIVLPSGAREVPLVIQDRNLDDDDATHLLNGRLLHKVTSATAEFFGPYTLVNGVIWPKMSVQRRRYRLRLLNGSNARTYCLRLVALDAANAVLGEVPLDSVVRQIGSDGGLLAAPARVPAGGLVLAPAERADLFVDFGALDDATGRLALVNTAFAPFHLNTVQAPGGETDPTNNGQPVPAGNAGDAVPGLRLPFPFVMSFELGGRPAHDPATPLIAITPAPALADDVPPLTRDDLPVDHGHRVIALVENPPGMLMFYELIEATPENLRMFPPGPLDPNVPDSRDARITIRDRDQAGNLADTTYAVAAIRFEDRVSFFVPYGGWELWELLNLTNDSHPIHVHLVQFRVLARRRFDPDGFDPVGGTPDGGAVALVEPVTTVVEENERGWKDTVRVNPNEMVTIAARFDGFTGRYMYHCHILEHEDHEMMRPFVVLPRPVMDQMPDMPMNDGMHHMGPPGGMGGHP